MHFSIVLLTLAATASAIDIRGWTGNSCIGSYTACTGVNPNICCEFSQSSSSNRVSISVTAIPRSWRIQGNSWTGGRCRYIATSLNSDGASEICLSYTSRGDRTGGSYTFLSRKRAEDESCPAEQPDGGRCEASVKPDILGLEDGTVYNIAGLTDEKVEELESIAMTGAGADAVPAEFEVLSRPTQA
ncbi:hypothetical protein FPOAC2_13786 [Fusarium poae]|jgi:hypothetical protein|uniref:uncharacterized protein n=1 Tax=Fusarium poae TaxID=36050 RepID=UPI001D058402|nr:uncharacterized protein FPOAC1_012861 [Fusarium poae]KAG8664884.1 hypothetical protein FPOAC1_012861 [Fusarium poae]